MTKRVIITGATGFIGRALCARLSGSGYEVIALTRDPSKGIGPEGDKVRMVPWDARTAGGWGPHAEGALAIINLAGENIGSGIWSEEKRRRILESRLDAGRAVVEAVKAAKKKPALLIQASAIGYYGSRGEDVLDEGSASGTGYLAWVTRQWEESTAPVEKMGVRRVIIRTAVVIGEEGGFLARFLLPFRLFLGAWIGKGSQWISWVHIEDEVRAIVHLMERRDLKGAFNLAAPAPVRTRDFFKKLGRALGRPVWIRVPAFTVRFLPGAMGKELFLASQRAVPKRLEGSGFSFTYPEAGRALESVIK